MLYATELPEKMNERIAINAAVDLVPSWYRAAGGGFEYTLRIGAVDETFRSQRRLTPQLSALHECMSADLPTVLAAVRSFPDAIGIDLIQEYFAERWLTANAAPVLW